MNADCLFGHLEEVNTLDIRCGTAEVLVDERLREPVYDMYVEMPILDITFFNPLPIALT